MKRNSLFCILMLIVDIISAQEKVILKYGGCSFDKEATKKEVYVFNPSTEALEYVKKICSITGIDNG